MSINNILFSAGEEPPASDPAVVASLIRRASVVGQRPPSSSPANATSLLFSGGRSDPHSASGGGRPKASLLFSVGRSIPPLLRRTWCPSSSLVLPATVFSMANQGLSSGLLAAVAEEPDPAVRLLSFPTSDPWFSLCISLCLSL